MAAPIYSVTTNPNGGGWRVTVDGTVQPLHEGDTKEESIRWAERKAAETPGATVRVQDGDAERLDELR